MPLDGCFSAASLFTAIASIVVTPNLFHFPRKPQILDSVPKSLSLAMSCVILEVALLSGRAVQVTAAATWRRLSCTMCSDFSCPKGMTESLSFGNWGLCIL